MSKTVLIVDDIPFVRKTLADILIKAHFQVIGEASDGIEAFEIYSKLRPDIVTMDIVMPQMSGIETTRRLLKLDKNAKIVIISAMGHEHLVMEAINLGAKDYIVKPFSTDDVIKTITRAILSDQQLLSRTQQREKIG